jgi:hypothetical protein
MSGEILGTPVDVKQRPRAVLVIPEDARSVLAGVFPHEHVSGEREEIYAGDWDVCVTASESVGSLCSLLTVGFGVHDVYRCFPWDQTISVPARGMRVSVSAQVNPGRILYVPTGLHPDLDRLVHTDLVPGYESVERRMALWAGDPSSFGPTVGLDLAPYVKPFLTTSDGGILAGRVRRHDTEGEGEMWILPSWVKRPREWLKVAWAVWADEYEGRIPKPPEWQDSVTWFTPEELAIHRDVARVQSERDKMLASLDSEVRELTAKLAQASTRASKGMRRLLSSDGDDLADAVGQALRDLGFEVKDMDQHVEKGKHVEDFRVSEGDWEALTEVKGYTRGARAGDLFKINRFVGWYEKEIGHPPDAQWFIVNALRMTEPGARQLPLATSPEDALLFAEAGGVIISTVDLFEVWRDVMTGRRDKDDVRQVMREATGRITIESMPPLK